MYGMQNYWESMLHLWEYCKLLYNRGVNHFQGSQSGSIIMNLMFIWCKNLHS